MSWTSISDVGKEPIGADRIGVVGIGVLPSRGADDGHVELGRHLPWIPMKPAGLLEHLRGNCPEVTTSTLQTSQSRQLPASSLQTKMTSTLDIPYATRTVIVAYYFQIGMQQEEICDRLNVEKAACSEFISIIEGVVPDYQSADLPVLFAASRTHERTGK